MNDIDDALVRGEKGIPNQIEAVDWILGSGRKSSTAALNERVVRRMDSRRAPAIKVEGSSMNDCRIWETVLDESTTEGGCIFVTDDDDFRETGELHPQLLEDLKIRGGHGCIHRLDEFFERHLKAKGLIAPMGPIYELPVYRCFKDGAELGLVPGPSQYGGWGFIGTCPQCGARYDTGEPYDD